MLRRVTVVLGRATRWLLDALAPRRCACCDGVSDSAVCERCTGVLTTMRASPPRRLRHGSAYAGWEFEDPVRHAIHRGKFGGDRDGLRTLSGVAWQRVAARASMTWPVAAAVPVPLGPRRRRQRGYNQAEIIAACVAEQSGMPVVTHLVRTRDTPPQSSHDEAARRRNVDAAFAWHGGRVDGATLLLVDDVLTTGATLSAASAALVAAGARRVDAFVIAAVP